MSEELKNVKIKLVRPAFPAIPSFVPFRDSSGDTLEPHADQTLVSLQNETTEALAREGKRKQRQLKHLEERAERARDELLSVWESAQRGSFPASSQNKCALLER